MKFKIIAALLVIGGAFYFSQAQGSRVVGPQEVNRIAAIEFNSGYSEHPYSLRVVIFDNGQVKSFITRNGETKSLLLAQLRTDRILELKGLVDSVGDGDLQDTQPDQPLCEDAPATKWTIYRSLQSGMDIQNRLNCHTYVFPQGKDSTTVEQILTILDGLLGLEQL